MRNEQNSKLVQNTKKESKIILYFCKHKKLLIKIILNFVQNSKKELRINLIYCKTLKSN